MSDAAPGNGDAAQADRPPRLEDLLEAISADYHRAATDDERRARGLEQLAAITLHLQRAGVPSGALRPVTAIMHALEDVDRGNSPPLLKTQRRQGGRSIPSDELRLRGLVGAAVTLFMRADETHGRDEQKLERAARKVGRQVEGWRAVQNRRVSKSGSQSLPEAVKDWRERAMGGSPDTDPDARIYASVLRLADNGAPPAGLAEWVLAEACKLYR